jgi:hypothetical protein
MVAWDNINGTGEKEERDNAISSGSYILPPRLNVTVFDSLVPR